MTPGYEPAEFSVNSGTRAIDHSSSGDTSSKQVTSAPAPDNSMSGNTSSSGYDDKASGRSGDGSQQAFGVAPLPATSGLGNPIHLRPGEKVPDPSTFTRNTVNSAVTTDEQSYLNSAGPPMLPDVVTPEKERDAKGGMFGLPLMGKNMIPESSLPMGDGTANERDPGVTIQSASPHSTTAALAGNVPREPRGVPESSLPMGDGTADERDPGMTIQSASPHSTTAALAANVPREPRGVPERVQDSQAEAGVGPEASANPEAVKEKRAVEHELEERIPEKPAVTEGGSASTGVEGVPAIVRDSQAKAGYAPEASANPEAVREKRALEGELEQRVPEEPAITAGVPEVVRNSQAKAGSSLEASANPEAVREKRALEEELERKVPEEPATVDGNRGSGLATQNGNMSGGEKAGLAVAGVGAAAGLTGALAHESSATRSEPSSSFAPHGVPPSVLQSIEEMNKGSAITPAVSDFSQGYVNEGSPSASTVPAFGQQDKHQGIAIAPIVPDTVQKSIAEAHQSPEAAANPEAVQEKTMVEDELRQKVRTEEAFGEPAPSSSPALAQTAPGPTGTSSVTPAALPVAAPQSSTRVEGLAAPASAQASTPVTKAAEIQAVESRDVSPMSKSPIAAQTQPMVTSGVGQSAAPLVSQGPSSSPATVTPSKPSAKMATPSKPTPSSSRTADSPASGTTSDKKKKRTSFFGKLKEKFSDKDKK